MCVNSLAVTGYARLLDLMSIMPTTPMMIRTAPTIKAAVERVGWSPRIFILGKYNTPTISAITPRTIAPIYNWGFLMIEILSLC